MPSAASGLNAWVTNLAGEYNTNELSTLVSPCFDFSDVSMDPFLSFSLWFDSESCCDEAWVERSIDGGQTWTKVGTSGTGQNWYNDGGNQWWDGDGGFTGWVTAYNTLTGIAGQPNVRIRFVFSSDGSIQREGIGVDDINIDATPTAIVDPIERLTGISLAPNPTGGISTLSVSFAEPVDAVISIHDAGALPRPAARVAADPAWPGLLVCSVYGSDPAALAQAARELADSHGRVHLVSPDVAALHTGHGNVMPQSRHGGPGRTGGGEELGGVRALNFYHRRSAIQASTAVLAQLQPAAAAATP